MNLLETLQQLKTIKPDPAFSDNSRRAVLASVPTEPFSSRYLFARFLAATGSLVLAGALIFIIAGGLSTTNLAPQFSSIDPTALHAEAQAIDMQIDLLNVNYNESTVSAEPISATTKANRSIISNGASLPTVAMASSTTTSTISVNEVLQGLSQ
jgi:hypothetical protein